MFKKLGVSLSILGLMAATTTVPQVQASDLTEAIQASVTEDYAFESSVSIMSDNRQELADMPFDLDIFARMEGIKNGFDVWSKATMNMTMDDFDSSELSESMSDLSKIWMGMDVEGTYFDDTQTNYFSMSNIQANSDNEEVNDILGMIQESLKIFANNYYRYSASELVSSLRDTFGTEYSTPEIEELLTILDSSSMKLENLLPSLSQDFIDLLESGLFEIEGGQANGLAFRTFDAGNEYTITLTDRVSPAEAKRATDALASMMTKLLPTMKDEIMWELENTNGAEAAATINEFLNAARNVDASIVVTVDNGRVTKSVTNINLGALRIPVRIMVEERYRYEAHPAISVPTTDENEIVDVNKIIQGFMTIGKMAQSQFMSTYDMMETTEWENEWEESSEWDETSWDTTPNWEDDMMWEPITEWENADPGMQDYMMLNPGAKIKIMLQEEFDRITSVCNHMRCARVQVRRFRNKMHNNYNTDTLDMMEEELLKMLDTNFFYWDGR